jgi:hypothetical protein
MAKTMSLALAVTCCLCGTLALAGDAKTETSQSFKISIVAQGVVDVDGKKQKMDADTELMYTWRRKGAERILSFDSALTRLSVDGAEAMNMAMSRARLATVIKGKQEVIPLEKAPNELKNLLQDAFGVPICKLEVDASGKELKRTMLAGPGAKTLLDHGMIANALLFHPPYLPGQDRWEAPSEVSMGNGNYVRGKLTYQKKDGNTYAVTGTLTTPTLSVPNNLLKVKDVRYDIRGEQTYDPTRKEWVSGKLLIEGSFAMAKDDTAIIPTRWTMTVTFTTVAAAK